MSHQSPLYSSLDGNAVAAQEKLSKKLIDSAIIIAIISGVFYTVGYWGELRAARELGIPIHLMHPQSIQAILLAGAADVWLLLAVLLLLWALLCCFALLFRDRAKNIRVNLRERFNQHRVFYRSMFAFIAMGGVLGYPFWSPLHSSKHGDDMLPDVVDIKLKDAQFQIDGNWKYVTRNDGMIVLKEAGKKRFVILSEDILQLLLITHKSQDNKSPDD